MQDNDRVREKCTLVTEKWSNETRFHTEATGTPEWPILCFPGQKTSMKHLRCLSPENVKGARSRYFRQFQH